MQFRKMRIVYDAFYRSMPFVVSGDGKKADCVIGEIKPIENSWIVCSAKNLATLGLIGL